MSQGVTVKFTVNALQVPRPSVQPTRRRGSRSGSTPGERASAPAGPGAILGARLSAGRRGRLRVSPALQMEEIHPPCVPAINASWQAEYLK